jgi:hypothetical protein
MDFIGEKCVACGIEFKDGDDIVVCPECGSPHHRACYKAMNSCANEALHGTDDCWHSSAELKAEEKPEKKFVVCPACHFPNALDEETCIRCGYSLADMDEDEEDEEAGFGIPRPYLGFNPDEDMGGAPLRDVSDFVRTNTIYYIPIFKRMKDTGRSISFNLISFIFPPVYFANRRMWFWALLSLIVTVLLSMPIAVSYLIADGIETSYSVFPADVIQKIYDNRRVLTTLIEACNIADLLIRLVFCLFSNKLYFRFVLKSLRKLRSRSSGELTRAEISQAGGVKLINTLLVVVLSLALTFAAMYATYLLLTLTL